MRTNQTRSMPTRFHLVLIKPTHYDDDGYPIQWVKAAIPSNTLACLNGLAEDASRRQVLGSDVVIRVHIYDETNRRVRPDRIIRMIHRAGGRALVGFVGVQSNQFPRLSIWRGRFCVRACRFASAGFMSLAASRCCQRCPRRCERRRYSVFLLCRRSRAGPARPGDPGRLGRRPAAALQLYERPPLVGG
jgi:hypothetical protein